MTFDSLILPNKKCFVDFYESRLSENNMNILLYGPRESCKTSLIEYMIQDFVEKYKNKFTEKQLVFRLNAFDEINLQSQNNEMSIFCQNNTNTNKIVIYPEEWFGWKLKRNHNLKDAFPNNWIKITDIKLEL